MGSIVNNLSNNTTAVLVDDKDKIETFKSSAWSKWSPEVPSKNFFHTSAKLPKRRKIGVVDTSTRKKLTLFQKFNSSLKTINGKESKLKNANSNTCEKTLPNGNYSNFEIDQDKIDDQLQEKHQTSVKTNSFMLEQTGKTNTTKLNNCSNINVSDQNFKLEKQTNMKYKLSRKNSSQQFTHLGMLTPAYILLPSMHHEHVLTKEMSNKLGEDLHLTLAAAHINDAIHGRGKFGEARAIFKPSHIQKCYKIISSPWWAGLLYFVIAVHCIMIFFEQPAIPVTIGGKWISSSIHPIIPVIDGICLSIYIVDIFFHVMFYTWRNIWYAKEAVWIRVEIVFTSFFIIDFSIFLAQVITNVRLLSPFRSMRASMLLCKAKNVSHIFNVLISIFSKLGKVLFIIGIFIIAFASVGIHIFMEHYHDLAQNCSCNSTSSLNCTNIYQGAFDNVAHATLHMFVLMSTENYPEFIIPAFQKNWENFFYFGLFLYAGVFFLMAILLAIIVESYWDYSKRHVKQERKRQREELAKAWNLLNPLGKAEISSSDKSLLKLFRILKPKNTNDENLELIIYMSECGDGVIDPFSWTTKLVEALSFEFEDLPAEEGSEYDNVCAIGFCNVIQKMCRRFIHANAVSVAILVLIMIHSILFCLMWTGISEAAQLGIQSTRTAIVTLFCMEVLLRVIADGKDLFNFFDILDMTMVLIASIGDIVWYIVWFGPYRPQQIHLGACVVASSVAVLIRACLNSHHARSAVQMLRNIYPVMFDLILLVITIIFNFAVLGFEIFQNVKLSESVARDYKGSYLEYGCNVGFDTFGCSLLIVFQIVTTNDWQEIMLGATLDAGWAASLYFVACYLIVDMIVMNLFVAISIEAYKKLAIDNTTLPNNSDTNQDGFDPTKLTDKNETSFTVTAFSTLGEIFASSRKSRTSISSNTLTGYASSPYSVRRGTLGSLNMRTPTPSPRLELRRSSLRDENKNESKESVQKTPPTSVDLKPRSIEGRQQELKKRQQQKKERRKTKLEESRDNQARKQLQIDDIVNMKRLVRVIKPYRARNANEMNVKEGEVVEISGEQQDDMILGPKGWFPVANVVENSCDQSSLPTGTTSVSSPSIHRSISSSRDATPKVHAKVQFDVNIIEKKPRQMSPRHRISQTRMIRKPDAGDWRREIHGDITVMNKDEMRDLNRLIRGGLERRHTSRLRNIPSQLSLGLREEIHEENENQPSLPQLTVSEFHVEPPADEELYNSTTTSDTNTLTLPVPQTRTPRHIAKQKARAKGDGQMPEWMQKFVTEKHLNLDKDVKFDESPLTPNLGDE